MVTVNVAGLDDTAFSDSLFRHKKGAYTGAHANRDGLIKRAQLGTLFLDEVKTIPFPYGIAQKSNPFEFRFSILYTWISFSSSEKSSNTRLSIVPSNDINIKTKRKKVR